MQREDLENRQKSMPIYTTLRTEGMLSYLEHDLQTSTKIDTSNYSTSDLKSNEKGLNLTNITM